MFYLLSLEWKKQRKFSIFRVLIGFYLLLLPTLILVTKRIPEFPPPINSSDTFFRFPTVFAYLGYSGNWLSFFFLGFLGVILVTQEFGTRTLRQNIIAGLLRREYYLSKVYFILAVCLGATLYYALIALSYGFTHTPSVYTSTVMQNIDYIPRYFLMCLGYMSFGFLLGVWIRRTGIALFLYFSYVMFLELILRWVVHLKLFEHKTMQFYPLNAIEDLVPIPISDVAEGFEKQFDFNFFLSPTEAVIASSIYISLFLFLAYRLLERKDL